MSAPSSSLSLRSCCGQPSVWVENVPGKGYAFCRECRKEVLGDVQNADDAWKVPIFGEAPERVVGASPALGAPYGGTNCKAPIYDELEFERIPCPDDCGGCNCHTKRMPPCTHCEHGHGCEIEPEKKIDPYTLFWEVVKGNLDLNLELLRTYSPSIPTSEELDRLLEREIAIALEKTKADGESS